MEDKELEQKELKEEKKPDPVENEDGSLDVSIEEEPAGAEEPKEKSEEKPEDEDVHKKNSEWAAKRLDTEKAELKRRAEAAESKIAALEKKPSDGKTHEDLESDLAKKPVSTIEEIASRKAEEIVNRREQERKVNEEFYKTLEGSKNKVLKRHPELENPSSVKSQIIMEVLEKNPYLKQRADGPILAMVEMEDIIKEKGMATNDESRPRVPNLPKDRNLKSDKTVTLSKEDLEFCREHNMDPKKYALRRQKLSNNERVEV